MYQEERKGMVLKWYLNSQTVPIYQWIPPSRPQGLGAMRGKIDLDFEISKEGDQLLFARSVKKAQRDSLTRRIRPLLI